MLNFRALFTIAAMAIPLAHAASLATSKSTGYQAPNVLWTLLGCAPDDYPRARLLVGDYMSNSKVTPTTCVKYCDEGQWHLAGVENGNQCFCAQKDGGFQIGPNGRTLNATNNDGCTTPSAGDPKSNGGGPNHLLLFESKRWQVPTIANVSGATFEGCYADDVNNRLLPHYYNFEDEVSNAACVAGCKADGYDLAGTEDYQQCWCGHSSKVKLPSTPADPINCQTACKRPEAEYCGGFGYLDIYKS